MTDLVQTTGTAQRMPSPDDMVRTDHTCPDCGDHIYAGEPVLKTRSAEYQYRHLACTATPVGNRAVTVLPPNPQWRGWDDYDGWRASYRTEAGLHGYGTCANCGESFSGDDAQAEVTQGRGEHFPLDSKVVHAECMREGQVLA